ncbi:MAG: aspartate aminotransferase family protein [Flavobacteriales bacterium]|nr:aspartate aminotransferase family protein [Flavobacteriales bacterium]|tara:strand:- start:16020 stop:17201 length:1182 start_codon:yes stop_codon:yes gene_type:complete
MRRKDSFLRYQAQITQTPFLLEIDRAEGSYIYTKDNKKYIDLIAGVSSCTLGHSDPTITKAITKQLKKHTHVMVYGEFIQDTPLQLSKSLAAYLPIELECTYLVNSGTEAIEGAIKLAKRKNGRKIIVSCINSYHGSTHGSLSATGNKKMSEKFQPLVPNHKNIRFNNLEDLEILNNNVSAIIIEPIQGGTNFLCADQLWIETIRKKCTLHSIELIFDEIQTGFGRTGKMFGFELFNIVPDILCLAKGMGGGMPIGAFVSSKKNMDYLSNDPQLGHITTFGGHPVCCAAALATFNKLKKSKIISSINHKRKLFISNLIHPRIKQIHGVGLMIALEFENEKICQKIVRKLLQKGIITFYFLFNRKNIRISPPLNIKNKDIMKACKIIKKTLDNI